MTNHNVDIDGWEILGIPNHYTTKMEEPVVINLKGSFTPVNLSPNYDSCEEDYIPERVIFLEKEGITIALWKDGSMTTAKASGGDKFQPEIGVAIVTMKKIYGSTTNFWSFVEKAKFPMYVKRLKGLTNGFCA